MIVTTSILGNFTLCKENGVLIPDVKCLEIKEVSEIVDDRKVQICFIIRTLYCCSACGRARVRCA